MSGTIVIRDLDTMRELIDGMQETASQGYDLVGYCGTWVTQKDGFEPSPVCALRPFAAAMDAVEGALDEAFWIFQAKWSALTSGVADSIIDFQRTEGNVVDTMDTLLNRPTKVYVNGKVMYE